MRPVLYIEPDLCHACETCRARRACKPRAIVQFDHNELPALDPTRCLACLSCVSACPFQAIRRADRATTLSAF